MIYKSATQLIGKTPLLELSNIEKKYDLKSRIVAKLEFLNPAGSAKDRIALEMIEDARRRGILKPGATIIEPTSGNTGIGIASVAAACGYKAILTMPDTMSVERRTLLSAYGAKVVLTDGKSGMAGAIKKAEQLAEEIPGAIVAGQFVNPANPAAHYKTTGPEIWADTEGTVDIFVAGAGTGGTVSGVGRYLKEQNPEVKAVAVEPENSAVLSGKPAGPHKLQGIGAGFIPQTMDVSICDEIIPVSDDDALETAREVARTEGILIGISGGAALYAAISLAKRPENEGKLIVVLFPDTGDRYLSTELYAQS